MKKDLSDQLQKILKALHSTEELTRQKLEELGTETMDAFDKAIRSIDKKVKIGHLIKEQAAKLRQWRIGFFRSLWPLNYRYILSMPFIYGMIVPAVILHLGAEIYQQVCFRLYKIPRVRAREYFRFDRALLPYLNWLEKVNCVYCSYVNNLFQFVTEIGGRTERYWCPIKYLNRLQHAHSQYDKFADFLEADTFREKWEKLKDFSDLQAAQNDPTDPPKP